MTFTHDTEEALAAAAALVNTDPGRTGEDTLHTPEDLVPLPRRDRAGSAGGPGTRPSWTPYARCARGCASSGPGRGGRSSPR